MVLMKDIAEAVGVSKATVSLVLNGTGGSRVSASMRKKVLDTAKSMGYHGNDLARSLRTGKTNVIGVLVTDISNDFFGTMSFHIQEEAKKFGYLVITANTNESDEELDSMISVLIGKKVDGIIVVPTQNCGETLKKARSNGIQITQIDRFIDGLEAAYVGTDNYSSTCHAVGELLDSGRKRIAMLTLKLSVNAITERKRGYIDTMRAHGCYCPELVEEIDYDSTESVNKALESILHNSPDAIFFSSRRVFTMAMEILSHTHVLDNSGIKLLCYDKAKSYKGMLHDNLWYIEQPIEQMAKIAFSFLMEAIDGATDYPKKELLSNLVK